MICPKCGNDTGVIDSRLTNDGSIRRRRVCHACKYRFTTYEISEVRKAAYEKTEKHEKELTHKMHLIYQFATQSILEG